jgi:segregation and condensation protein B
MSPENTETNNEATEESDHSLQEAAEAIIFAADEPVTARRVAEIVSDVTGNTEVTVEAVERAVRRLNEEYEASDRALQIHEWGEGYRMATRSALSPFVKTLFIGEQETSLSRSLMETLAVIAYRQPVTRPEVDFIRGVNSDYAIRKLLEIELVDVQGRADSLGRPLLYETTPRFLEQFGLNTLDDLPTLREVEDLLDDPAFDEERAKLLQLDAEDEVSVDVLQEDGGSEDGDRREETDSQ